MLLLDWCSTHHQPEVVRLARSKQKIMLCLPLHTTHKAQPLDCTVFAPLKSQWRTVCHEFLQCNPGRVITKFNFNSLFSKAWLQSVIPAIIMVGLWSSGVYPFNSSAIKVPSLQSGSSNTAVEGKPPAAMMKDHLLLRFLAHTMMCLWTQMQNLVILMLSNSNCTRTDSPELP